MKKIKQCFVFALVAGLCFSCEINDGLMDNDLPIDLSNAIEITEAEVQGSPWVLCANGYNPLDRYGMAPKIVLAGNLDNSFDIAWLDMASKTIKISSFNANGHLIANIIPDFIGSTNNLLGFAKVSLDGSYVLGYSKDNASGDKDFELWIARFNSNGNKIFNTRIFGNRPSTDFMSKGTPGLASSARIVYNEQTQRICFYTGHTMLWNDNVRHQGGYIGFLDLGGRQVMKGTNNPVGNTWFFSHNFDQRLMVADGKYYALAHGDAYPRSLGFSVWTDDASAVKNPLINTDYFTIPGEAGDNTTNTQTGGFVSLPDGTVGIVFASSVSRKKRDACFLKLDKSGNILASKWLTQNTISDAVNPKIAVYGTRVLIAWQDYNGSVLKTNFIELDLNGKVASGSTVLENIVLQPMGDWVMLPNGDIIWAICANTQKFTVFRIKNDAPVFN